MHSDIERRSSWYYMLATVAFAVVVLALVQMVQVSATALASTPSLKGALAQAKGGPVSTGTPWPAMSLKGALPAAPQATAVVEALQEGFEDGELVFTQLSSVVATCVPGICGWGNVTTYHHTGSYSAFASDVNNISDQSLVTKAPVSIPADATSATLTFWQRFAFESVPDHFYDGGVLEVSTDNGATWNDGGSLLTMGAYNGTLETGDGNPLSGRQGWGGSSGGWVEVRANFLAYRGFNVSFRLRMGTDNSNATPATGWWVDDFSFLFLGTAPCIPSGWADIAPYPTGMADIAVANNALTPGHVLFAFGGFNIAINSASYRYDTNIGTWAPIAPLPSARYNASATNDGDNIFIIGGLDSSSHPTNTAWHYDFDTNSYSTLTPMSVAVYQAGVVVLQGTLYRIGGMGVGDIPVSSVESYSMSTQTWSPVAPLPQPGANQAVLTDGLYIYVAGGLTGNGGTITTKTYRYDPVTNIWDDAAIADLPSQRSGMAYGFLNGHWLLAGGLTDYGYHLSSIIAWDPATNTWSSRAQMLAPRGATSGGIAGGQLIIPGGTDAEDIITSSVVRYFDASCGPPTPTPTSCPIQFSDVPQGSTFYPYIRCLACRGILGGYPDGSFKPNSNVTRGQLSKIVSNAAGFNDPQPTQPFQDVAPASTFHDFIGRLASRGYIGGYACGGLGEPCVPPLNLPYFRPNDNATRGQISKIVSNTATFADPQPAQLFQDVAMSSPFHDFIGRLSGRGYMSGYTCGGAGEPCVPPGNRPYFRSNANATRGQTSKIVGNTFFPNCQTPSQ